MKKIWQDYIKLKELINFNETGEIDSISSNAPSVIAKVKAFLSEVNKDPFSHIRKNINSDDERQALADEFNRDFGSLSLRRAIIDIPLLGKTNQTLLVLQDSDGNKVLPSTFKKYFPSKYAKHFDMRGKYMQDSVVVAGDHKFYQSPTT